MFVCFAIDCCGCYDCGFVAWFSFVWLFGLFDCVVVFGIRFAGFFVLLVVVVVVWVVSFKLLCVVLVVCW